MSSPENPLDQLIALEARGRRHVVDLSTEEDRREYWRAVSFRVANHQLLFDEADVSELLTLPPLTVLPGTKQWVAGIANVRGELLPIVNFGQFLFGEPVLPSKQARVLVITHEDIQSGLIVDQVYGIRRLPVDELKPATFGDVPDTMKGFLSGCYQEDETFQHIIDLNRLIKESEFMQAAA